LLLLLLLLLLSFSLSIFARAFVYCEEKKTRRRGFFKFLLGDFLI